LTVKSLGEIHEEHVRLKAFLEVLGEIVDKLEDPSPSTGGVCQPRMGSSSPDRHQEAGVCTTKGSKVRLK
jgi:hypothetical protein